MTDKPIRLDYASEAEPYDGEKAIGCGKWVLFLAILALVACAALFIWIRDLRASGFFNHLIGVIGQVECVEHAD